jgi:hypothetical protein
MWARPAVRSSERAPHAKPVVAGSKDSVFHGFVLYEGDKIFHVSVLPYLRTRYIMVHGPGTFSGDRQQRESSGTADCRSVFRAYCSVPCPKIADLHELCSIICFDTSIIYVIYYMNSNKEIQEQTRFCSVWPKLDGYLSSI